MPNHQNQPQYRKTPSRQDEALNGANAQRRAIQGAYGAKDLPGSDCGSSLVTYLHRDLVER